MTKPRPETHKLIKKLLSKTFRIIEAQVRSMELEVQAKQPVDIKQLADLTKLLLSGDKHFIDSDKAAGFSQSELTKKTDEEIEREISELIAKKAEPTEPA